MAKAKKPPEPARLRSVLERHPKYAQSIGMISAEVAVLDIVLGELLAALLHIGPGFGRTIYLTPHASSARLKILENVLVDSLVEGSKGFKVVKDFVRRAKAIMGRRHDYIHNVWGLKESQPGKVSMRALPYRENQESRLVPLNELKEQQNKIRDLIEDVMRETDRINKAWPPYTFHEKQLAPLPDGTNQIVHPQTDRFQGRPRRPPSSLK